MRQGQEGAQITTKILVLQTAYCLLDHNIQTPPPTPKWPLCLENIGIHLLEVFDYEVLHDVWVWNLVASLLKLAGPFHQAPSTIWSYSDLALEILVVFQEIPIDHTVSKRLVCFIKSVNLLLRHFDKRRT